MNMRVIKQPDRRLALHLRKLPILLLLLLPIWQIYFHFPDLQVYPFADEWFYVGIDANAAHPPLSWLWEQHGDHRIPLQKALQLLLLQASHFDFRILILCNLLIAGLMALLVLRTAINLRGHASALDASIPLMLFNPMTGFALWGFHLQFLSSIFFTCMFAWSVLRPNIRSRNFLVALLAIAGGSLCGLNGLLQSTLLLPLLWLAAPTKIRTLATGSAAALCTILIIGLWATWTRSGTVQQTAAWPDIATFFAGLLGASYLPPTSSAWMSCTVALLVISACFAKSHAEPSGNMQRQHLAILLLLTAISQLLAVAWGRTSYQNGWQPTLAMHYGILSMLLPILGWLCWAQSSRKAAAKAIGLGLTAIFAYGWVQAEQWRTTYTLAQTAAKAQAYRDIKDERIPPSEVVRQHAAKLWSDDPSAIITMQQRIPILRESYKQKWPDHAHAKSDHPVH